jgi:F0F1-type ATP synthase membrane subunit b/b'
MSTTMHDVTQSPEFWQQYGPIGVVALIFLLGLISLFRLYVKRIDRADDTHRKMTEEHLKERADWQRLQADMRADYERKHRENADQYAAELRKVYEESRTHEDSVRKEFSDMLNSMASDQTRSMGDIARVLDKIYERFVGPRARKPRD